MLWPTLSHGGISVTLHGRPIDRALRHLAAGRPELAVQELQHAHGGQQVDQPALALLGEAYRRLGQLERAHAALEAASRGNPPVARLRALVEVLLGLDEIGKAISIMMRIVSHPDSDAVRDALKLAELLTKEGEPARATEILRNALQRQRGAPELELALAQSLEELGLKAEAEGAFERVLARRPDWPFAIGSYLEFAGANASDAVVRRAETLLQSSLPELDRALIGYGLGKVNEARGDYAASFACFGMANQARLRAVGPADADQLERRVADTIRTFDAARIKGARTRSSRGDRYIFVVGVPRSGTSLVEQIIAAHPMAVGCGEMPDIARLPRWMLRQAGCAEQWPAALERGSIDSSLLEAAAHRYESAITARAGSVAIRFVDKAPTNFFHVGLIAVLFPQATIIWCDRDPRDVAISLYAENFALSQRYATSLDSIAHYISAQRRLMLHWKEVGVLKLHAVRYEDLVGQFEREARALISAVGLPWDPACLEFHSNSRAVQTPSRWQVRKPIYSSSVGRWRRYEAHLEALMHSLRRRALI